MPVRRRVLACVAVALMAQPAASQAQGSQTQTQTQAQTQTQPPPQGQQQDPPKPPGYKETVVVSASKTEQQIVAAPATMTVIGPETLTLAPSNSYADVLRGVPGLNVTQLSARDVNVTSRGATSSLATSQLAVLDGRSLYLDFFGFTMWDFMPANLDEIKRIEVIRGPASAVWGANALTGVINIITKSPREMAGQTLTFGAGLFDKQVNDDGADAGTMFYVRGTHAQVVNERWAYKISAGGLSSDALARPVGNIQPADVTPYPPYTNSGTAQPKFDVRFDYEAPGTDRKIIMTGGVGGTDGIMHTGIGPFDIAAGTTMSYWKVNFTDKAFRLQAFMNLLNGDAANLLSIDTSGNPILLDFNTKTFDVELGDTRLMWNKHVFTYGGNLRFNKFHLTIAPGEDSRTEGGAYLQDEFLISSRFRVVAGARVDKFSSIENAVFSPRLALVVMPKPAHSFRVTYNRAFRAPSMVNNNLDITVATPLPLAAFGVPSTFLVPTAAVGNPGLTEERVDAYEVAYTGNIRNRANVSAAFYYTNTKDSINFTPVAEWGALEPPPGWPLPPLFWALVYGAGFHFPKEFTYLNLGEVAQKGIEIGFDGSISNTLSAFVNYAYQFDPKPTFPGLTAEQAFAEVNHPANHLVNVGLSYVTDRIFSTVAVSYSGEAYWQDVLDSRYYGTTEPYTLVNLTAGLKFSGNRYAASIRIANLLNDEVQQHVFGDVFKRQIVGEFRINLPR